MAANLATHTNERGQARRFLGWWLKKLQPAID